MPDRFVSVSNCAAIKETPKAILVQCAEWEEDLWIPKSQISDDSEVAADGDEGTLVISSWIAEQKGIS